jgi:hypothetical protein
VDIDVGNLAVKAIIDPDDAALETAIETRITG